MINAINALSLIDFNAINGFTTMTLSVSCLIMALGVAPNIISYLQDLFTTYEQESEVIECAGAEDCSLGDYLENKSQYWIYTCKADGTYTTRRTVKAKAKTAPALEIVDNVVYLDAKYVAEEDAAVVEADATKETVETVIFTMRRAHLKLKAIWNAPAQIAQLEDQIESLKAANKELATEIREAYDVYLDEKTSAAS